MLTLLCTVRECREPLTAGPHAAVCVRGHSFDVARNGYLNLLQPQDRRSRHPGDSAAAVAARRRFLDRGFGAALTAATAALLPLERRSTLLDVGCGEGAFLGAIRRRVECQAAGVDISVPAVDAAARRHPDCRFVVANADRFVPCAGASLDAVTSITARLHPAEFHRVLAEGGTLLVSVAGEDDLVELREAVLGRRVERDRTERTIAMFAPLFAPTHQTHLVERMTLDREAIADVMTSSYRALRTRERERLSEIGEIDVTISRDVLLFEKR